MYLILRENATYKMVSEKVIFDLLISTTDVLNFLCMSGTFVSQELEVLVLFDAKKEDNIVNIF